MAFAMEVGGGKGNELNDTEVIERLRASRQREIDEACSEGKIAGADWATSYAEYGELAWLADEHDAAGALSDWRVEDSPFNRTTESEFWESAIGSERTPLPHYVRGFVAGAVEAFEKHRPKVDAD